MPEQPPAPLVAMLERLGLANAAQVARMGHRVKRLARDLPRFESLWVDALLQARILTPFQAAEINAGRGPSLRLGPYVIYERLSHPYYVASYRVRNIDSGEFVRLAIVENAGPRADAILRQLHDLVGCVKHTDSRLPSPFGGGASNNLPSPFGRGAGGEGLVVQNDIELPVSHASRPHPNPLPKGEGTKKQLLPPLTPLPSPLAALLSPLNFIIHAGAEANRIYAAMSWIDGRTATELMIHHGRFPSEIVLEIARAMVAELFNLEKLGICHGDISTSSLILTDAGDAVLTLPGLRGILRPEEGYAFADLLPEAYDSLAPERVAAGTPPNMLSDIYACGCVWWQLLCGRPPLAGGNSLAKLRAAQSGGICDAQRYAPDTPASLASAISACLQREPNRRPESLAKLADALGPPTRVGKEALADFLARAGRPTVQWTTTVRSIRKSDRTPLWIAGAVCCLAAAVAVFGPMWQGRFTKAEGGGRKAEVASGQWPVARKEGPGTREQKAVASNQQSTINNQQSDTSPSSLVMPTTYQQPVETKPADLVLAADQSLVTTSLDLREGQCVRGPSGERAVLHVSAAGLVVDQENVRFENIDFVWQNTNDDAGNTDAAMVRLLAGQAEFRGCSFQCVDSRQSPVPAIRWVHPAKTDDVELALPSGRVQLIDCLFHRIDAGLDCRTIGALAVELKNVLHLDAGPLVRLDHCPRSDEPMSIVLGQVTLRGGGPLLECLLPSDEKQPGEITVFSTACAFAPKSGESLVRIVGMQMPDRLLTALRWSGQGSLVTPQTPMITLRGFDGQEQAVDESPLSIAGLVRSEVIFAGEASNDPAASRLIRWQAPLQSADPPGVDCGAIPKGMD